MPTVNLNPTCLRRFCVRALRKGGRIRGPQDGLRIAEETFKHCLQTKRKEQIMQHFFCCFLFACFIFLQKGTLIYSFLGQR